MKTIYEITKWLTLILALLIAFAFQGAYVQRVTHIKSFNSGFNHADSQCLTAQGDFAILCEEDRKAAYDHGRTSCLNFK